MRRANKNELRNAMPKTYDDTVKATARTYYVLLGMSAEQISTILGPTATTILRWAEDAGWSEQRQLRNSSSLQIGLHAMWQINEIYRQAREDGKLLTSKEVDQVSKHRKMMEGLNKDLAFVSNGIEAMGLFMELLREKDEELFNAVAEYSMEFTQQLAEKFGDL